jgi:acyl-CoA thioesterase
MADDDLAFLGLERTGGERWTFELVERLCRLDLQLYGGTALAVAVATMEAEAGRPVLWATVQFVRSVPVGSRLDVHTEVLAGGHRASQLRCTATCDGEVVFCGLGSAADARPGSAQLAVPSFPAVAGPESAVGLRVPTPFTLPDRPTGWMLVTDMRVAEWVDGSDRRDRRALWARWKDRPLTRPAIAFVADMVPSGVAHALGRVGGGISLDNSIRFGPEPVGDWLLVELDPHLAEGGYGHGAARLWSEDGRLLGIASQSAKLLLFD